MSETKPDPASPSRFSFGTWTSVNDSSAVSWACSPILSRLRPRSKPCHAALDDEEGDALVARVGVGAADHDDQVGQDAVGDEGLRPVEDVVVARVDRSRTDPLEVGAGARLGHRDRRHEVAGDAARQPALLLLVGPEGGEVRDDDVGVHGEARAGGAGPRGLLGEHHVVAEVGDARARRTPRRRRSTAARARPPCATPRGRRCRRAPTARGRARPPCRRTRGRRRGSPRAPARGCWGGQACDSLALRVSSIARGPRSSSRCPWGRSWGGGRTPSAAVARSGAAGRAAGGRCALRGRTTAAGAAGRAPRAAARPSPRW